MKVAIYSPYLDTFGGGERYILTIAESLSTRASVDLLFDDHLYSLGAEKLKNDLSKRFDLDLSKVVICKAALGATSNFIERFFFLKKYNLLFYLTDGSIFYPSAKKNILHIQSPLQGESASSLWGKFKLKNWDLIIYNSKFTKENCQKYWPINSKVIYPPVDTTKIKSLNKKKYFLSVGRFFGYLKDKKHEILIKAFKDLYERGLKDWSFHLAGSAGEGDKGYLDQLESLAKGLPIKFYPNLDYDDLIKLYGESSIYWHAAGFKEDDPTKMEHFGISTVEAMAGGCIPIVIGKGGQTEIVEDKKSGFLWQSLEQLKQLSIGLINNQNLMNNLSRQAIKRSRRFTKEVFLREIDRIIE